MSEIPSSSPRWNNTTKLVISITMVAIAAAMVIRFQYLISPVLVGLILSYILQPIAGVLFRKLKFSWRLAVNLIYLLFILLLLGGLTAGGVALVQQVQNLISFLQKTITDLPGLLDQLSKTTIVLGPFQYNLGQFDLSTVIDQILGAVQPLLSNVGTLVGTLATGAFEVVGWTFFSILISYFIVGESNGVRNRLINLNVPRYSEDVNRFGAELGRIWNAFLRGQLIILGLTISIYAILLGGLGLNFFIGLALMAGLARFIPYVGPFIAWSTYGLVAYFQGSTIFGLDSLTYAILIVAIALVVDNIIDQMISPRLMADALALHPAAVMVAALVGLNLLGVIGMILAAPVLATLKLALSYIVRKLVDQDPWENLAREKPPKPLPRWLEKTLRFLRRIFYSVLAWLKTIFSKLKRNNKGESNGSTN